MDIEDHNPLISETENEEDLPVPRLCIPRRYRLFALLFLAAVLHGSIRTNFNLALVAMVNDTSAADVNVTDRCPGTTGFTKHHSSKEGEFSWNANQQSELLSAFYYGYVVLAVPGGYLSERLGGKSVLGWGSFLAGVFTLMLPLLAWTSYPLLMCGRVAAGLASGPIYVSLFSLAAKWAPKFEVTILLGFVTNGFILGTVICFATSGLLINSGLLGGWPSVFYIYGGLLTLWSLWWMVTGSNSPDQDSSISQQERIYIEQNTENRDKIKYENPSLKSLLSSPAVLCLWLVAMTDSFGFYVMYTELAFYLKEMLAYDIAENGLMMSLIYTACFLSTLFACPLVDYLRSRGVMSTRAARVMASLIGEFGIALVLLTIALAFECNRWAVVALFSVGQFVYGATAAGFMVNSMDIAPRYTGTVTGVGNCLGMAMSFVAPLAVGGIVGEKHTRTSWRNVFLLTAAILIFGVLVFSVFARGEELPWAKSKEQLESQDEGEDGDSSTGDRCDTRCPVRTLSDLDVITEEEQTTADDVGLIN